MHQSSILYTREYFTQRFIVVPIMLSFLSAWACIGGIWCASTLSTNHTILVSIFITIISFLWLKRRSHCLILLGFFIAGAYRFTTYDASFQASAQFFQDHAHQALSGTALVIDQEIQHGKRYPICLTIRILSFNKLKGTPAHTVIKLYLLKKPSLLPGDELQFKGLICKRTTDSSYEKYLFKEGIVTAIYSDRIVYKRIARPWFSPRRWCIHKRESMMKHLLQKMSPKSGALFSTLFMGGKAPTHHKELRSIFSYWGIVHFLARSGLHVMVLIGVWRTFLVYLRIPWAISQIILLLILGFYYLLSWSSISFIRACIAWFCYQCFIYIGRTPRILHILALTTLIVLLNNPYQLFFLDFQLSFGLTCALAWWQEAYYQHTCSIAIGALNKPITHE